jgi:hypothetical protein
MAVSPDSGQGLKSALAAAIRQFDRPAASWSIVKSNKMVALLAAQAIKCNEEVA